MPRVSHYKYLEKHLPEIFKNFGLDMNDGRVGIISAHGDKGYGYRDKWNRAGIDFCHGMALYLLTDTPVFDYANGDHCSDWVIAAYKIHKSKLPLVDVTDPDILSPF